MAVVELTDATFEQAVADNDLVLIDFWAPWCGPCRSFAPIYEKIAERHPDVVFAKVNTEEEQALANHFQIRSIPTVMVIRQKVILMAQPGVLPESALEDVIAKAQELDMDTVRAEIAAEEQQAQPATA
ncbi:MAG: thioredoxin [Gammaproteobacteria bacterium]|jgi:thioredoxin 1|nr:thioredoxin [Gammaproteobacteria bacterium]